MTYYVKLLGSTDMPMANYPWDEDEMHSEVRFPPKPPPNDISPGDELVYYAVGGYKRVFVTARVEESPQLNQVHSNSEVAKRWPYASRVALRPETRLTYVSSGPELNEVTPGLQDNVRHGVSHFEIGKPQFEHTVSLLRKKKIEEDQKIKTGWKP